MTSDMDRMHGLDDMRYYYEDMMNLQRKMMLPMIEMNPHHIGFVNQSRQTVAHHKFADVKLRIYFADTDETTDIETHRFILAAKSAYFETLFSENSFKEGMEDKGVIPLYMVMVPFEESPAIREFFRLFYVPIFEDAQFTPTEYSFIVSNVLTLHHLAEQFMFHALRKYCRHKIYEHLDLNVFTTLINQCVARNEGSLYVIPGRESLFRRIISWFVCCAKVSGNGLPFGELEGGRGNDVIMLNPLTQQPNSLIPPPQRHDGKKRKRISESSNRKTEALQWMRQSITDFDQYDTYSFSLQHDEEDGMTKKRTRIRSFGRLCETCSRNKSSCHFTVINDELAHRKWHIYLDLGNPSVPLSSSLYVKLSGAGPVQCQTRITVLSKLYKSHKAQIGLPTLISTSAEGSFVNLHQFSLNEPEFCYEGECDKCHLSQTRLFIIKYEIDASM